MLNLAIANYALPIRKAEAREKAAYFPGPYRAVFLGKGAPRDFPWGVYGARDLNIFGRLWSQSYATAVVDFLNMEMDNDST